MADIKLNEDLDYLVLNGDFVTTANDKDLDEQNSELLLLINEGGIKDFPFAGIGLSVEVNAPLTQELKRKIEEELGKDGITVDYITTDSDNNLKINLK